MCAAIARLRAWLHTAAVRDMPAMSMPRVMPAERHMASSVVVPAHMAIPVEGT